MHQKTLFKKAFWSFLGVYAFLFAGIFFFTSRIIQNQHIENLKSSLESIARSVERDLVDSDLDFLKQRLDEEAEIFAARFTLIDADGTVLADTQAEASEMENHALRPEVKEALNGKIGSSLRTSATVGSDLLYVAVPVFEGEEIVSVLRLSVLARTIRTTLSKLFKNFAWIILAAGLLGLLVSLVLTSGMTKRIISLREAAESASRGNFRVKVHFRSDDELKSLAESFNLMTRQIESLFRELSEEKEALEAILAGMQEALCILSYDHTILFANKSFMEIAGSEEVENHPYWEFLRSQELDSLVEKAIAQKKHSVREVRLGEGLYFGSVQPFLQRGSLLLFLSDISEIKEAMDMKRNLLVNASHELKTPLTAIRGFAETLLTIEQDEEKRRFLGIIERNALRLTNLTSDLLLLSKMESNRSPIEVSEICLDELIESCAELFKDKAAGKDLKLTLDLNTNFLITTDAYKLEQILINLIDNAIKYTDKGFVEVESTERGDDVLVLVRDSGRGIAPEKLQKVFERFYTVDKSRSRSLGGTGLGLSIVKHVAELLHGEVSAESKLYRGSVFTLTLPKHFPVQTESVH